MAKLIPVIMRGMWRALAICGMLGSVSLMVPDPHLSVADAALFFAFIVLATVAWTASENTHWGNDEQS